MNLKTTLGLLVLVAIGAAIWLAPWLGEKLKLTPPTPDSTGAGTLAILSDELTPEKITYVKVEVKAEQGGDETVLERGAGGDWSMPGQWPARQAEVQELVNLLGNLRSRFMPETNIEDMKRFGLDPPPVFVTVKANEKEYELRLGED